MELERSLKLPKPWLQNISHCKGRQKTFWEKFAAPGIKKKFRLCFGLNFSKKNKHTYILKLWKFSKIYCKANGLKLVARNVYCMIRIQKNQEGSWRGTTYFVNAQTIWVLFGTHLFVLIITNQKIPLCFSYTVLILSIIYPHSCKR